MIKVVYFDEGSATDFLQISFGGNIEITDSQQDLTDKRLTAVTNGEVKVGKNLLTLIKASVSAGFNADLSKSKNSLYKTTLSNTILADFINYADSTEEEYIKEIIGYNVEILEGSFAYVKLYTPYLKMVKEDSNITKEMQDINFLEMDELLNNAKGYYDLLADNGEQELVLRFNINAFRNNYSLADLTKMNLVFYGIEVGICTKKDLKLENELDTNGKKQISEKDATLKKRVSPNDLLEKPEQGQDPLDNCNGEGDDVEGILKVYDVILAGIKR